MTEKDLWAYVDKARAVYDLTKDPLVLDAMRVVQEAITDVVTTTNPDHELSPMQKTVIRFLDRMDTARQTLYS